MDWTPLANDDPLRGDPPAIASLATRFAELADALADQATRIAALDPGAAWVGLAAERFGAARDQLPRQLRQVARRLGLADRALRRWATEVEDAQSAGLHARDRAREAEADITAAQNGIQSMRWHARQAAYEAAAWNEANPDSPRRYPARWSGPDWPARLSDAEERLERARRDFRSAVSDHRRGARAAASHLHDADRILDDPRWAVGPVGRFLAQLLDAPTALEFILTPQGLQLNTAEAWRWETHRQAGIDARAWNPDLGLAPLDGVAVDAWEFYADLYARRPDEFLWAGMATLAGGTFYAAFQDIHVLRRALETGAVGADQVGDVLRETYPGLPGEVYDRVADTAAEDIDALAGELRFVETTFLHMQKQIFDDLAWQHVAYDQGGLEAMEALYASGEITEDLHIAAWRDIASGDPQRIAEANRDLLHHEQRTIIGDQYDSVRNHSSTAWAITMGMSIIGTSPIPGGRRFPEVVPYEVHLDTPDRIPVVPDRLIPDRIPFTGVDVPGGGGLYVDTPDRVHLADLPLHNVSIFDNRWKWIEEDMLPAWMDHVEAGTAGELVSEPIADQADRQRLVPDRLLTYDPE